MASVGLPPIHQCILGRQNLEILSRCGLTSTAQSEIIAACDLLAGLLLIHPRMCLVFRRWQNLTMSLPSSSAHWHASHLPPCIFLFWKNKNKIKSKKCQNFKFLISKKKKNSFRFFFELKKSADGFRTTHNIFFSANLLYIEKFYPSLLQIFL